MVRSSLDRMLEGFVDSNRLGVVSLVLLVGGKLLARVVLAGDKFLETEAVSFGAVLLVVVLQELVPGFLETVVVLAPVPLVVVLRDLALLMLAFLGRELVPHLLEEIQHF